jgi:hypothetical protein
LLSVVAPPLPLAVAAPEAGIIPSTRGRMGILCVPP